MQLTPQEQQFDQPSSKTQIKSKLQNIANYNKNKCRRWFFLSCLPLKQELRMDYQQKFWKRNSGFVPLNFGFGLKKWSDEDKKNMFEVKRLHLGWVG